MAESESKSKRESAKTPSPPMNLTALIRSLPADMVDADVQARAKAAGMDVPDTRRIYKVRWNMRREATKGAGPSQKASTKRAAGKGPAAKPSSKEAVTSEREAPSKAAPSGKKKNAKGNRPRAAVATPAAAPATTAAPIARAKTATGEGSGFAPSAATVATFRQAVLALGLDCAKALLARYETENKIV